MFKAVVPTTVKKLLLLHAAGEMQITVIFNTTEHAYQRSRYEFYIAGYLQTCSVITPVVSEYSAS
jgi:hypothetical protein